MTSRLSLVQQSLYILVDQMAHGDKISICTYAGSVGTILTPTTLSDKDKGITLSTLGFGQGNYNDHLMEQLADHGNGNYYYIDTMDEAKRLFTEELAAVMEIIAKDVKVQVEFNPEAVVRYRLIGYENRNIQDQDFDRDTTDAGEIGAGHRVTALYELELTSNTHGDLGTVHLRYKLSDGDTDIPVDVPIARNCVTLDFRQTSNRLQFTVGLAEFAEILRQSPYINTTISDAREIIAKSYSPHDEHDVELLTLIQKAAQCETNR